MENIPILNKNGEQLDMELIFSFTCSENSKNYVVLNNKKNIFQKNSRYTNLDIFEIVKIDSKQIYVSDVQDSDWEIVKKSLQFTVFKKLNEQ